MSGDVIPLMLFVAQEGRCFHCDEEFAGKALGSRNTLRKLWTRDHVQLAHEGNGRSFNIVLACGRCNHARGSRPPTEDEIAKARSIFAKGRVIWRGFYGANSPVWPDNIAKESALDRAWASIRVSAKPAATGACEE